MTVVAIVQARMGSSRLPGKVLADLEGEPMLARVVARCTRATTVDRVVVATTTAAADRAIEEWCRTASVACTRGAEADVLDRYHQAATVAGATVIVRITADCPLIDPELIDRVVVARSTTPEADYASNTLAPRTFPRGLDVEAFTRTALESAWLEERVPGRREHVTPAIWHRPKRYRLRRVALERDLSAHRWTVDTSEDLELVRALYRHFGGEDSFSWRQALAACERHTEWSAMNRSIVQKALPT
ncbi:MAG TPA: glycosyltransferase family protein [Thermoanaerobaculia bacterium]|nr:glycosyltransferase family protein [Thermoanaerobaculia bacterium]